MLKAIAALIIITTLLALSSCKKNTEQLQYPIFKAFVAKHAKFQDTVVSNLTIEVGHRELPHTTSAPKNALYSKLEKNPSTGWYIYEYSPRSGFTGIDSVEFSSVEPVEKQRLISKFYMNVH